MGGFGVELNILNILIKSREREKKLFKYIAHT